MKSIVCLHTEDPTLAESWRGYLAQTANIDEIRWVRRCHDVSALIQSGELACLITTPDRIDQCFGVDLEAVRFRQPCVILIGPINRVGQLEEWARLGGVTWFDPERFSPIRLAAAVDLAVRLHRAESGLNLANSVIEVRDRQYRALFECAPDAIYVEDTIGTVIDVNPAACALHEMSREELIGKNVRDLVPPELHEQLERRYPQVVAGELKRIETMSLSKSGKRIPVEVRATTTLHEGKPAVLLYVRDMTVRAEADRQVRRARASLEERVAERTATLEALRVQLLAVVDAIPGGVCWIDSDLHYLGVNQRFASFFGLNPNDVVGKPVGFSGNNPRYRALIEQFAASEKQEIEAQIPIILRGREHIFLLMGNKYNDGQSIVLVGVDITERERAREQLALINHELSREVAERQRAESLAAERQNALAHITRLSSMGEMASALAHELNQPLASISNYVSGLLRRLNADVLDAEAIETVSRALDTEAHRASEIIRRLRNFVRKETSPHTHDCDVNQLIREVVSLVGFYAREHDVHLELNLATELPLIHVDAIQIQQVLVNLVNNSIDAFAGITDRRRFVELVSHQLDEGWIEIAVRDNACGIAAEDLSRLFDHYFTTKPEGMGMGLIIARSIVEAHGGRLQPSLNIQHGVTFSIQLPISEGG